jgi:hypothetical protein
MKNPSKTQVLFATTDGCLFSSTLSVGAALWLMAWRVYNFLIKKI